MGQMININSDEIKSQLENNQKISFLKATFNTLELSEMLLEIGNLINPKNRSQIWEDILYDKK
jgi:hypothetical protein